MFFSRDFRVFSLFFEVSTEKIPVLKIFEKILGRFFPLFSSDLLNSVIGLQTFSGDTLSYFIVVFIFHY